MNIIKNKKGFIDDFGSLLLAGVIMIIITIIILVYAGLQENAYKNRPSAASNLEEASYTTRAILEWELESGMKIHEALVKHNQEKNIQGFIQELQKTLEKQKQLPYTSWLLVINSRNTQEPLVKDTTEDGTFKEVSKKRRDQDKRNSYLALTRVTIPDGSNDLIEVVIKQIRQEDWELYTKIDELK